jgi:hypothetical protein
MWAIFKEKINFFDLLSAEKLIFGGAHKHSISSECIFFYPCSSVLKYFSFVALYNVFA